MNNQKLYREAVFVEFVAQNLWHLIRPFLKNKLSRRCKRCILNEHNIEIKDDGICQICHEKGSSTSCSSHTADDSQKRLDDLIHSQLNKENSLYDGLVLVSGGKDSAYMLNRLQNDYPGIRLMTMMVDNGFISPFAEENLKKTLAAFDLPHIKVKLPPSFVKKIFRMTLLNLDKQTGYSIVDLIDGFMTFDQGKIMAYQMNIPMVFCGLAKVQTENVFGPTAVEFPLEKERSSRTQHYGINLKDHLSDQELQYFFQMKNRIPENVPRFVLPFTVWDLAEEEIIEEVIKLGFVDKKKSRPLLTNMALIPVIGMAESARFGHSSFEPEFAEMIRTGKSDRRYWLAIFEMLEYSTKTGRFIGKAVKETLKKLDIKPKDLGINQP